jgi:hypothetical protein
MKNIMFEIHFLKKYENEDNNNSKLSILVSTLVIIIFLNVFNYKLT